MVNKPPPLLVVVDLDTSAQWMVVPYDRFAADWNRNADKLAATLVKAYQSDLEVQAICNSTLSMTLMGEHWAFTNLLNSMAW